MEIERKIAGNFYYHSLLEITVLFFLFSFLHLFFPGITIHSQMKKSYIFIAIIAIAGFVIWRLLQNNFRDEGNDQKAKTAKSGSELEINYDKDSISYKLLAYKLATDFVKESLTEPTTAEFPNTKEKLKHIKYLGKKRYRINSWVDSQDTYGATTRKRFSCILKIDSSSVIKESFRIEEHGNIPKK